MFDFALTPVDELPTWGEADGRNMPWFGLSHGTFALRAPGWEGTPRGGLTWYVAQPWADLLGLLPVVLEAVPAWLASRVVNAGAQALFEVEVAAGHHGPESQWWAARTLDMRYAGAPPVKLWRTDDLIHARTLAGEERVVATDRFLEEVTGFHHRFLASLDRQIEAASRHRWPEDTAFDLEAVVRTHHRARGDLDTALARSPSTTNWGVVRRALAAFS